MTSKAFLHSLLESPSPTGFEQPVQRIVREHMKKYADEIVTDLHGNVIVGINTKASRRLMLAGHSDQIGLMVRHITKEGFVYVSPLGGIDVGVLHGARVTIHSEKRKVPGVIGRKPIHQQSGEERDRTKNDIDKIWIDIGAKNKKDAEKLISIGDCVTFELGVLSLGSDLISSPGLDNKVGLFIAMETLKACSESKLGVALYAVSTVQEEVGLRGAITSSYGINADVGVAIDVTHASDNPANENARATECKLGGGPLIYSGPNVNPVVGKMLRDCAKKGKIPYQLGPSARLLGTDAREMQVSRGGMATACIGVPNRYMHSQAEICSYKDLDNCVKLLTAFIKQVNSKTDFRPM